MMVVLSAADADRDAQNLSEYAKRFEFGVLV
jgi:hypothetical protein